MFLVSREIAERFASSTLMGRESSSSRCSRSDSGSSASMRVVRSSMSRFSTPKDSESASISVSPSWRRRRGVPPA
ncbi:Uncharacterised protein [uncultured archaeon]|nr:Uncharacterised protein [uncultured archaeon]